MRKILLISLLLFETFIAGNIKGRVTNYDSKKPLEYVIVMLKGSNLETITDSSGYFLISNIPHGEYTLSIQTTLYEKYEKLYNFSSSLNKFDIDIRLKKVVPYIPRDSLIENYHSKLSSLEPNEVLEIFIDSCKVMHSSIYVYSTFNNNSKYPIYLIQNYPLFTSSNVDVYLGNELLSPRRITYYDTIGMKIHPDSSDLIIIKPRSSIKYPPLISRVNVCENSEEKYEVKLTYNYKRPEMIRGSLFTSGAEAFYNSYKDVFYYYNIAFRGKVESANKILVEGKN